MAKQAPKPKVKTTRKYTVLLLYPDYMTDAYGQETYAAHVEADSPRQALSKARRACKDANGIGLRYLDDLYCLFACLGWVDSLCTD